MGGENAPERRMMTQVGAHDVEDAEPKGTSRDQTLYARFVTYNVLSSKLSSPSYYTENDPNALDPRKRLEKVIRKLEREVTFRSIICLQEVSMHWCGPLHTFFARNGYHFIFSGYGGQHNGFMGVGIAVPLRDFEILDVDVQRLSDTKSWPRAEAVEVTGMAKLWQDFTSSGIGRALTGTQQKSGPPPEEEAYSYARRRFNSLVFARLKAKSSGQVFCVANYHMPCAFFLPDVMTIHTALSVQHTCKLSNGDPLIFCGDFNITPGSSCYKLVTEGRLPEDGAADPKIPERDPWKPQIATNLNSAYRVFTGSEPDFTNFAKPKDRPVFVDTLDYIFITPGLEVVDVEALPARDDVAGPLPNEEEPSDHVLIAATIRMAEKEEQS